MFMKKSFTIFSLSILLIAFSCNKSEQDTDIATFNYGSANYTSYNPSVSINSSYGTTINTLTFPVSNGAKLVLNYKGTSTTSYYLQSTSYYQDSQGNVYYASSYSSTISITGYEIVNSNPVISGTFNFVGYSSGNSVEITNGKFTKVTN
jgi:hypothetical protein